MKLFRFGHIHLIFRDGEREPLIKCIPDDAEALEAMRERMRVLYGQQDENDAMGYEGGSSSGNETDLAHSDYAMEDRCDIESMLSAFISKVRPKLPLIKLQIQRCTIIRY